jgi:phosphopantothenoylcysteine synthetase/decarboxylase
MQATDRGIGSEGLEQGGPNLGNDYTRSDLSVGNAGDALTTPNTTGVSNDDDDALAIDQESSRDLDTDTDDEIVADDTELIDDDFDDEEDDEDFDDLDEDDEDEESTLERGI